MSDNFTLTKEQLQKLSDGESVQLETEHRTRDVRVNPPCDSAGHEWSQYSIHNGTPPNNEPPSADPDKRAQWLTRTCTKCGETQYLEEPVDELFEDDE